METSLLRGQRVWALDPEADRADDWSEVVALTLEDAVGVEVRDGLLVQETVDERADIGKIEHGRIFQAKGHSFSVQELLGGDAPAPPAGAAAVAEARPAQVDAAALACVPAKPFRVTNSSLYSPQAWHRSVVPSRPRGANADRRRRQSSGSGSSSSSGSGSGCGSGSGSLSATPS